MALPEKINRVSRWQSIFLIAWWIAVFAILFFVVESCARYVYKDERYWFDQAEYMAQKKPIDFLFVGTSRVYASIDAEVFANTMEQLTGKPVTALNMGRGYTTIAQYYFAIKHFAKHYPEAFKMCTIFLESSNGLPDMRAWDSDWILPEVWAQYILPYLTAKDIVKMWTTRLAQEQKYQISFLWFTQGSRLMLFDWDIRKGILQTGARIVKNIYKMFGIKDDLADNDTSAKMILPDGDNMDSFRQERARKLAVTIAQQDLKNQQPVDWEKTILKDIVSLVHNNGGKVVIVDMPVSSIQMPPLETDIRKQDKQKFSIISKQWKLPLMRADIKLTDEDFPDYWHIQKSRRQEFSGKLAVNYFHEILSK